MEITMVQSRVDGRVKFKLKQTMSLTEKKVGKSNIKWLEVIRTHTRTREGDEEIW